MRRLLLLASLALALVLPDGALAHRTFTFEGRGFGHAIGMPQWGAYGFARRGGTYDEILAHYYRGTQLGVGRRAKMRVLLARGSSNVEIGSDAAFSVRDASGTRVLPAGTYSLGRDLVLKLGADRVVLASPVRFLRGKQPLRFGQRYRGSLIVRLAGTKLSVVNKVGLEAYVRGVIANEMPASWHPEALKAQAVAARSFALASKKKGGIFDVYPDTRSQIYGGLASENPATSAAANQTKGQVVLYDGSVAWTFFSASSGGRTAAIEDGWPGSRPLPYLVSVKDPYDDISPYHRWGPVSVSGRKLAAKLGPKAPGPSVTEIRIEKNASGRVDSATLVGKTGAVKLSGPDLRTLLGLRSTWFDVETSDG